MSAQCTPPVSTADEDHLLEGLTEPQKQAVTHVNGPLLVLAGAGSGKTRVITRRIAYLVRCVGLAPWNILAITFTNKAAAEMRDRVGMMLSERQAAATTICTFHSLCARILRNHADQVGLISSYSIYDTADQIRAMKQILKQADISSTNFPPSKVLHHISSAKNELIDTKSYRSTAHDFYSRKVADLYDRYESLLRKNQALDFDDLLSKTVQLLRVNPDVLSELRRLYEYVLIDEYQDTNHAQFVLAHTLASEHRNLCVTGDPDQSIYAWRGANLSNILDFEGQYEDATVVRLEQNYRSTKNILAVADRLIGHNQRRKHKSLWTDNELGHPVTVVRCHDQQHEAHRVGEFFRGLHDEEGVPWRDMAVFYRVNSLSRVIEDEMRKRAIPYQIARGTAFFERKEIKDAVSYLRAIANVSDEVNLLRIINTPARGISDKTIKSLMAQAVAGGTNVLQVMSGLATDDGRHGVGRLSLNARALAAIKRFDSLLQHWRTAVDDPEAMSLRRFVQRVLAESGLEEHYRQEKNDPDAERIANLGELVSSAQQFDEEYDHELEATALPSSAAVSVDGMGEIKAGIEAGVGGLRKRLEAYLEQISLVNDVDSVDHQEGAVTLMTLHAAKGLEFPAVTIIGLEEGLLPHSQSQSDELEIEEERRLAFVGITRSQRRLMMSHVRQRTIFGQTLPVIASRFIDELADDDVEQVDVSQNDPWLGEQGVSHDLDATVCNGQEGDLMCCSPGQFVRHRQFGLGRIEAVRGAGHNTRVYVRFAGYGTKTLMLAHAPLERVDE